MVVEQKQKKRKTKKERKTKKKKKTPPIAVATSAHHRAWASVIKNAMTVVIQQDGDRHNWLIW